MSSVSSTRSKKFVIVGLRRVLSVPASVTYAGCLGVLAVGRS